MSKIKKLMQEINEGGVIDWLHLGNTRKLLKIASCILTLIILLLLKTQYISCPAFQYITWGIIFTLSIGTLLICLAEFWVAWEMTVFGRREIKLRLTVILMLLSYGAGILLIFVGLLRVISSCQFHI